jgi:hypothetical protein
MKKSLGILLFTYTFSLFTILCNAQDTIPRFGTSRNDDNTGRTLTYYYVKAVDKGPHCALNITPHGFETFIQPMDSILDTISVNASPLLSHVCDKIEFQCVGADTLYLAKHVIFNSGFKGPNLNIAVNAKTAYHVTFIFDGVAWRETSFIAGN